MRRGLAARQPASRRSANAADYRRSLVEHAHQLIRMGYERLDPVAGRTAAEEVITGFLVAAIRDVFDDPASAEWVESFDVHEERPVDDGRRKGKNRSRLDITISSAEQRPRQAFSFEAKRLYRSDSVSACLGAAGLGCFLAGQYARDEEDAGMLGYVQAEEPGDWAVRIGRKLAAQARRYGVLSGGSWRRHHLAGGPEHCYRSRHLRRSPERPIEVYHTLLSFQ